MTLAQRLAQQGQLSEAELPRVAEAHAANPDTPLHQLLIEKGFAKEDHVLAALADEFGLEVVDLTQKHVEDDTLKAMPLKMVHRHNLMPIERQNGTLVVATGDPYDVYALDELQTLTGLAIQPVLASPREISRLIKTHFGVGGDTVAALALEKDRDEVELLEDIEADDSELAKQAQEASVVKLVNEILVEAANERASDIHVEPEEKTLRIRYRIDGLLQTQVLPPEITRFQNAIISRIKIMSRLNIAEKRLPQDGRIKMRVQGREIDVRVSIIPMIHGEGIVMRLLDKGRMVFNLANVGMLPDIYGTFKQLIDRPHGIVLVTGPTGSGKSTTLYSALNEIKDEATKIITVEDPVEYQQPGISQIQVHHKIGLTFAHALRSILRHDPDVVLIGEMRDMETAESAIQASLTGHLVFSTLHTNDAPSAITRLIDMGIEPFLVASTVEGVMAQRLVRTICPDCKVSFTPDIEELPIDFPTGKAAEDMGVPGLAMAPVHKDGDGHARGQVPLLYKGTGCRACRQTGFRGRTGIHELMVSTDPIREMVVTRVNAGVIRHEAMKSGMKTLRQDGWRKVLMGITTVEEVARDAAELGLHTIVLTVGLCSAFHPTLFSGFARLQADPGDTLLNHYILEHSWRWLTRPDYVGTYWSPPFFHPQPLVLAYSENLLGTAPLYWLFRTTCEQVLAYQLWMLLVTALTYVSFVTVLRRLGVGHLLAALGGFMFAFGLPRVTQIGHQQLLPHLFAPWAVLAAWRLLERPTLAVLAALLAVSYLQVLASIYLGWFLFAGLGLFVAAAVVLERATRDRLTSFLRTRGLAVAGLVLVWSGLLAAVILPYRQANRGFHRPFDEVLALTPRPASWLASAPQGVWYRWLPKSAREPASELWIFPGVVPLGIAACGLALAVVPRERSPLVAASLIAAVILALLASRWADGSPWRAVYKWAPGGGAIRAVGRVVFTVELFALVGGLLALDAALRRSRFTGAIAGLLLVAGVLEQIPVRPLPSFEVAPWQARVSALRDRLTPGTVAYIELPPGRPFWDSQLTAMWAGLEANVPVVNGYSGRYPLGYPDWERSMTAEELNRWLDGEPVQVVGEN